MSTGRYMDIIFMQGYQADEPLAILREQGRDAALDYLEQWDNGGGGETHDKLPHGTGDDTYQRGPYHMAWNSRIGYIGLTVDTEYDSRKRHRY